MSIVDTSDLAVSFDDVQLAAQRLHGVAHRTPVFSSRTLDAMSGARVFLKAENLQRMGAFKFRGAYNRLAQMTAREAEGGVVAFSSGNHAQGVALAAQILSMPAAIVMPTNAPQAKVLATQGYGAEVIPYDPKHAHRETLAREIAQQRGATLVPPFNDPAIIAGAGTAALELMQDRPNIDLLLVCTGGGGFTSGCAVAAKGLNPAIEVYGVEPEKGNDVQMSFERNEIVQIEIPDTIADGARTQAPGPLTFAIVKRLCAGVLTVSDDELRSTMRFVFERLKLVIEPTGALALAALMNGKVDVRGRTVGVMLSGGNVDPALFASVLAAGTGSAVR